MAGAEAAVDQDSVAEVAPADSVVAVELAVVSAAVVLDLETQAAAMASAAEWVVPVWATPGSVTITPGSGKMG